MFVTNHFTLPALTVVQLYRQPREIELFFKWIKQLLRIKHFLGNIPNAVKTQIWIAVSVYLLMVILKRELHINRSLSEMLQILNVTLFEKTPINIVLNETELPKLETPGHNQLRLFEI